MNQNETQPYMNFGNKDLMDLSNKANSADQKAQELSSRVTKIEDSLAIVNTRLGVIENELSHLKDITSEMKISLDTLAKQAQEQKGFWNGVSTVSKALSWGLGLLFTGIGALIMFLLNKIF